MAKRTMSLTVPQKMNEWLEEIAGDGRGERQKFIISILNMVKNGLIVKGTEIRQMQTHDWQGIEKARKEAEKRVAEGETERVIGYDDEGKPVMGMEVFFTPADIMEDLKKKFKEMGLSPETRDTIHAVREEQRVLSQAFLSPDPSALPPPPPPKKDKATLSPFEKKPGWLPY